MEDEKDLSTLITANILPVDLNCLLYHLELRLSKRTEDDLRRLAIQKHMWSSEHKFFTDYNYIKKSPTNRLTLVGFYPLWLNVSREEQAQNVASQVESLFLRDGGVVTTLSNQSTQQWDSPNGWTPLQTPNYKSLAETIRKH